MLDTAKYSSNSPGLIIHLEKKFVKHDNKQIVWRIKTLIPIGATSKAWESLLQRIWSTEANQCSTGLGTLTMIDWVIFWATAFQVKCTAQPSPVFLAEWIWVGWVRFHNLLNGGRIAWIRLSDVNVLAEVVEPWCYIVNIILVRWSKNWLKEKEEVTHLESHHAVCVYR